MSSDNNLHHPIKAIVGLANPGKEYSDTRHNVGAWFVDEISCQHSQPLRKDAKLFGQYSKVTIADQAIHLLVPDTFMNRSGQAVAALCKFYKLEAQDILIAHDELDFEVGKARFKFAGGHGGHNGLRDTIKAINSPDFFRLRIGIGHPGNKNQVADYVLKRPSKDDHIEIIHSIDNARGVLEDAITGRWEQAMKRLHSS